MGRYTNAKRAELEKEAAKADFEAKKKHIRDSVPARLSDELVYEIAKGGFGISFPCPSGCQMRFIRNKKDLGGFYSYKQCGGAENALRMAISRNQQLSVRFPFERIKRPRKPKAGASCGFNGVGYREKLDKRRGEIERFYWVSYVNQSTKKPAVKTFSLGYTSFNADQHLHAYRTAIQFRRHWDLYGFDMDFDYFKDWKNKRVYELEDREEVSDNLKRLRRKKGETLKQHQQKLLQQSQSKD